MTTLIIHPEIEIQKKSAFILASDLLNSKLSPALEIHPPDLHLLDGTITSSIGIEEVRELIRKLQYHPYEAPIQIGLIIMANMLTEPAQNSLLKTLEEPTPQTQFILTTPHEKFLLPTILSRSKIQYVSERIAVKTQASDSKTAIDLFLKKDLVDKFLAIENLVNCEKEEPGSVHEFLADLVIHYRQELVNATRQQDDPSRRILAEHIRRINRAVHFISRNANKRLTLENLILQLEPSIMQGRH